MKKKILYLILSLVCNYILPSIILLIQFDFFKQTSAGVKLTSIAIVILFVLVIKFGKQLSNLFKTIKNKNILMILSLLKTLIIGALILVVLKVMKDKIADLQTITLIFTMCFCGGNIFHYLSLKEMEKENKQEEEDNLRKIISEELSKK